MLITIYDRSGNIKAEVSPNDSSAQSKEIQSDNELALSFTHYEHIQLNVDDYADFEGERYWLCEKYRPKQKSEREWEYNLKLYGIESLLRNILVIKRVDNEDNPVFTLTAPPREHVAMIVNCMNDGMGNTDWKVGRVDGTENIVIDYFGKYCDEALREIAEKVGAEYWAEGQTVNVCRCEHGEPVTLGYNQGLTSLEPDRADNVKFYTRLYPVGSSRNIDPEKYGSERLQLPDGRKYMEVNADKYGRVDHYEESAFADIYPRRTGKVTDVRHETRTGEDGKPFTIYYFKDYTLDFDPNDYMIGGRVMRVSFQEGSELAGLGDEEDGTYYFEVNFNSVTREFEIITIWPYHDDVQLPGGDLVPQKDDRYILWNLRMPDEYYGYAEQEFMTAVEKYNQEHGLDITVFKASTDHVWIEDSKVELTVGQRVRLASQAYFPESGYRDSRITKITRKVNLPSMMDIEIGDALSRSSKQKFTDDIAGARSYAQSIGASIALPDIIRTGDGTRPTDNNLFSARRSQQEHLSRQHQDTAAGHIDFEKGLTAGETAYLEAGAEFGDYEAGVSGAAVDADGNAEVETLTARRRIDVGEYGSESGASVFIGEDGASHLVADVIRARRKFSAEEVEIRKTTHVGGTVLSSPAAATISRVTEEYSEGYRFWRCYFDACDAQGRAVTNDFRSNDLVRCKTFNLEANGDGTIGNHYYWRQSIGQPGTVSTVYDELSGTRCDNLCLQPYPRAFKDIVANNGIFYSEDGTPAGGPTSRMTKPAAGQTYTVRLTGRWPADAQGRMCRIEVFAGGWYHGCAISDKAHGPADGFTGGIDDEEVTLHFTADADAGRLTDEIWVYAYIADTDGSRIGVAGTKVTGITVIEGNHAAVRGEAKVEHYVQLSDDPRYKDPYSTSIPAAGDSIVTLGSTVDPARQNVIMLSSYDGGEGVAPCLLLYKGIDTFELPDSKLTARLSPQGNIINGEFRVLVNGRYRNLKDYADELVQTYFSVADGKIEGLITDTEGRFSQITQTIAGINATVSDTRDAVDGNTDKIAELQLTADGLTSTVESHTRAIGQNTDDISQIRQTASEISLRVGELTTPRPNLCAPLTADLVQHPAVAGYFGTPTASGVDIDLKLARPIAPGTPVTIRLRGRFGATSTGISLFLGDWNMGVSIPRDKYRGGVDNETIVHTATLPVAGTPGTSLWIQMNYADTDGDGTPDMPEADKGCTISSLIIAEGHGIPAELLADDTMTERLYGTGIDIRKGEVQVTADNFVVVNNRGRRTAMVTADGRLTASLIDADAITARHVLVGDETGERVEIDPTERAVEIYDRSGRLCTTLDGKKYADGPGDVYPDNAGGTVAMDAGAHYTSRGTAPHVVQSPLFTIGSPCVLEFTAGTITASVESHGYEKTPGESPEGRHVGATVMLEVIDSAGAAVRTLFATSVEADAGDWNKDYGLFDQVPASTDGTSFMAENTSCALAPGSYRLRLTVRFDIEDTAKATGTVSWSAFAARWASDGYISRYFANGYILGSRNDRYVAAWHDEATGAMCYEVRNTDCALRSDSTGPLLIQHSGSTAWTPMPVPVLFGRISGSATGAELVAGNHRAFDGSPVTAFTVTRQSRGQYALRYPAAWDAHNYHAGAVLVRLTGLGGSAPTVSEQSRAGFTVSLGGADGYFAFEVWKL